MDNIISIYIKLDENNFITRVVSNIFLDNEEGWVKIDEWVQGEDRYLYAHADNGEYFKQKYGKPLYGDNGRPNFKYVDETVIELTEEEKIDLDALKLQKRQEISEACNQLITNGVDVDLSIGTKHFSLKTEDQLNLFGKQAQLATGAEQLEYHADGEECVYFSKEDMAKIIETAMSFVSYHTTYCNSIFKWINAITSKEELDTIAYGVEIPEEYQSEVLKTYMSMMK